MPKARQTLFSTYEQLPPLPSRQARIPAALLEQYFGGGMSSVLFQEVREFRSMAYSVGSSLRTRSSKRNPNSPVGFVSVVGTQGDKAMSAIALVDSLLKDMPLIEKNFESTRQELINDISNDFPSFRTIGTTIASSRLYGWTEDVNTGRAAMYRNATIDDMRKYYEENIKNHSSNRVIAIVGSKKKLNLKELEKYGKVVLLKEMDLFKK